MDDQQRKEAQPLPVDMEGPPPDQNTIDAAVSQLWWLHHTAQPEPGSPEEEVAKCIEADWQQCLLAFPNMATRPEWRNAFEEGWRRRHERSKEAPKDA